MKKVGKSILLGLLCSVMLCFPALADKLDASKAAPAGLSLDGSGSASWEPGDSNEVEKYKVILERKSQGDWDTYKSKTTKETSCEFSVSRSGYFRIRVMAYFYDDTYSDWAVMSDDNGVFIDKEDTDSGSGPSGDWMTWDPGPGYDNNGVPLSPGSAGPIPNYRRYSGSNYYGNNYYGPSYNNGSPSATANVGWINDQRGWWYKRADGTYPAAGWERINDKWYFFDMAGYMQTGWVWWNNYWYLCLPDGQMATGWRNVNDRWYYLNESGIMQTGYLMLDGKTYYLDANGARVDNAYSPDGHYFDANGVMVS